jgi:uncharacterized membrane protein
VDIETGRGRRGQLHYFPIAGSLVVLLLAVVALLLLLIEVGAVSYAYERIGISPRVAVLLLCGSLLGSYVNVPIAVFPAERVLSAQVVEFFGSRWIVPIAEERPRTLLAVNVGGAVIPTLVSVVLILRCGLLGRWLLASAVVAAVVHHFARPVAGIGIGVPIFVPPVAAALVALLLGRELAPALAYSCGTLGTLIGADLLNLRRIRGMGAPVASIGGAGTFDGIFLTGILAVLLA